MSYRIIGAAGALLAGALAAGCAHKDTVVGTWNGTLASPQGVTAKTRMVFTADGKQTMAISITGGRTPASFTSTGTYTVSGTSLTETLDTISVKGVTRSVPPGVANSETDQFKLDGDTLTLTKPGSSIPLVLTRDKAQ